jgi:hypothetical protein
MVKRLLLFLVLFLFLQTPCFAAATHSAKYTGSFAEDGSNDGPITGTVTITETGSNPCVVVGISLTSAYGNGVSDDTTFVSGVTLDGNAMTYLGMVMLGGIEMDVYYKAGAVGTNKNVVVTYEDGDNLALMYTSCVNVITYTGVDQSSPMAESATATGLSRDPSGTLSVDSTDNLIGDHTVIDRGSTSYTLTEDGAGTNRYMNLVGTLLARHYGCISDVGGVSGNQTMSYNISGSTNKNWAMYVYELKAAASERRVMLIE